MSDWERSLASGLLQVTVLSLLALVLLGRQRRAGTPGMLWLAQGAFAGVLLLSALAVVPRPALDVGSWNLSPSEPASLAVTGQVDVTDQESSPGLTISWDHVQTIGQRIAALLPVRQAQAEWPRWRWWIVVPLGGVIILASGRLFWSARYLQHLWSTSRSVIDDSLETELAELQQHYRLRGPVIVRESAALAHAAVIGGWWSILLLPSHWRTWTAAERRLVLAHELAHIQRGDIRWRWLAELVLLVHAYQPLVFWLHRRLVLEQELAADQAAAAVCGGSAQYLRTLSSLALRCDIRPERTTLAPVFTGLLMRRIEMLRTREGQAANSLKWQWLKPAVFVLSLVLVGGFQLPAAEEVEPPVKAAPVAATPDSPPAVAPVTWSSPKPSFQLIMQGDDVLFRRGPVPVFSRAVTEPALVPQAGSGLVEIRFLEVLQGPVRRMLTIAERDEYLEGLVGAFISVTSDDDNSSSLLMALTPNSPYFRWVEFLVDSVAFELSPRVTYRPEAEPGQQHALEVNSRAVFITWTAGQVWKPFLDGLEADKVGEIHGVPFMRAPTPAPSDSVVPTAGADTVPRLCLAYPNPKTIAMVFGEEELPRVFSQPPAELPAHMANLRQAVGGGLVTVVMPIKPEHLLGLTESKELPVRTLGQLLGKLQLVAIGVDVAGDNRLHIKVRGQCRSLAEAQVAESMVRGLIETARKALTVVSVFTVEGDERRVVDGGATFYQELITQHKLTIEPQPDGTADLMLESNGNGWFQRE